MSELSFVQRARPVSLDKCQVSILLCRLLRWIMFLNERAPPLVFFLLAAGPCFTILKLVNGALDVEKCAWGIFGNLVSTM